MGIEVNAIIGIKKKWNAQFELILPLAPGNKPVWRVAAGYRLF